MKFKINKQLVPIKAHFFFFFAALGPVLPQLNVFGRQLGVSPAAMGLVTAVLPLLWALAKPLFGYLVDFWPNRRKLVFMFLIVIMSGSYCLLWFLPMPEAPNPDPEAIILEHIHKLNDTIYLKKLHDQSDTNLEKFTCHWNCSKDDKFEVYLTNSTYINTIYVNVDVKNDSCSLFYMDLDDVREGEIVCVPKDGCNLLCYEHEVLTDLVKANLNRSRRAADSNFNANGFNLINEAEKTNDNQKESVIDRKIYNVTKTNDSTILINKETSDKQDAITDKAKDSHVPHKDIMNDDIEKEANKTNDKKIPVDKPKDNGAALVNNINNETPKLDETNENTDSGQEKTNDTHISIDINKVNISDKDMRSKVKLPPRSAEDVVVEDGSFYMTAAFWGFVVLMCVGTVAFNVANCIGDAVCFDVLGSDGGSKYGAQRAWGTAGYGLTALIGGWLVDAVSTNAYKDFTPAFVIALLATAVDLYSCRALTLPPLSSPQDSGKALREVLKLPRVLLFITFAVVAGTFDSFIIYYMFWFLEELAEETGHTARIKFIEGVVVAAQSFIGELLFFYFSGKIIKRWGFGTTLTFTLLCYGVRMALISCITDPWHLVYIESIMQGPTYALCYSSIVGYAAHVAPPGYSATVQGVVAGMDDGLGFALGSLVGGQLYARLGGRGAFRLFAGVAVVGAALHAGLFALVSRNSEQKPDAQLELEEDKMLPQVHTAAIYRDTVKPMREGDP